MSITPSIVQGTVSCKVNAGVAQDTVGNGNTASGTQSVTDDSVAPTITLSTGTGSPTRSSPITVTATLSQASTNFIASDITTNNAAVSGFSGAGTSYSFQPTPSSQGSFGVSVAIGVFTDAAGNGNGRMLPSARGAV